MQLINIHSPAGQVLACGLSLVGQSPLKPFSVLRFILPDSRHSKENSTESFLLQASGIVGYSSYCTTHPLPITLLCVMILAGNGHPIPPTPSALRYGTTSTSLNLPPSLTLTSLIGLP